MEMQTASKSMTMESSMLSESEATLGHFPCEFTNNAQVRKSHFNDNSSAKSMLPFIVDCYS